MFDFFRQIKKKKFSLFLKRRKIIIKHDRIARRRRVRENMRWIRIFIIIILFFFFGKKPNVFFIFDAAQDTIVVSYLRFPTNLFIFIILIVVVVVVILAFHDSSSKYKYFFSTCS